MATIDLPATVTARPPRRRVRHLAARLALLPTAVVVLVVYVGCLLWPVRRSFPNSKLLPVLDWVGLQQYARLVANDRFLISVENIAVFGILYLAGSLVLGFLLAVMIDQQIRADYALWGKVVKLSGAKAD